MYDTAEAAELSRTGLQLRWRIGTWNVLTLNSLGRVEIIANEDERLCLDILGANKLTQVQVYAHTNQASEGDKIHFYEHLQAWLIQRQLVTWRLLAGTSTPNLAKGLLSADFYSMLPTMTASD